ncbi:MAG TPA: SPOR domain-containing protein [Vicinamibacterales bacterium]|nr:SPOR domain-containing protein [Vicinamibacterales bacterium]
MATATHDDGFHEIQLNGKQLVFLFMAGTVVAVVIFLLGVFVGRGVRTGAGEGDPLVAQQTTQAPDIPSVASSTGSDAPASASEDLSYPTRLGSADAPREVLREAPAPPRSDARQATASPGPAAPAASGVPGEPPGEGFAIQLAALGKRQEAESIVRRLAGKGYSAYLMAPAEGGPAVYRVRVGKFTDRREAESVSTRLQEEEQFKPWIVR